MTDKIDLVDFVGKLEDRTVDELVKELNEKFPRGDDQRWHGDGIADIIGGKNTGILHAVLVKAGLEWVTQALNSERGFPLGNPKVQEEFEQLIQASPEEVRPLLTQVKQLAAPMLSTWNYAGKEGEATADDVRALLEDYDARQADIARQANTAENTTRLNSFLQSKIAPLLGGNWEDIVAEFKNLE